MRFHSRDNRLKGDRREPILQRGQRFPHLEYWGMLSRTLSLATVTLLIGCFAAGAAHAQNLEAGKSPSQIFAGACAACHKGARGLLKTVPASSLPGFLREHYTTSPDMASVLSSYLVSNGANDTRYQARQDQGKQGKDPRQEAARPPGPPDQLDRFGRRQRPAAPAQEAARPEAEQAAKPDADWLMPQGEGGRAGRNGKRLARPGEVPDAATESRPGTRQKLSKRTRAGEEPPKSDAAKPEAAKEEPAKGEGASKTEAAKTDAAKSETAKTDAGKGEAERSESAKPERAKPDSEGKPESAKVDAPKETGGEPALSRPDPVPPVTPAPSTPLAPPAPAASGMPEPSASPSAAAPTAPPAVAASAPPAPPAGSPGPPISK